MILREEQIVWHVNVVRVFSFKSVHVGFQCLSKSLKSLTKNNLGRRAAASVRRGASLSSNGTEQRTVSTKIEFPRYSNCCNTLLHIQLSDDCLDF